MDMEYLKIALIGCGKMGKHHLQAINLQEDIKVVAVVDPVVTHDEIADLVPRDVNIYSTAEEMFSSESPDIVHIVTPPETHPELAILSLNNNANIYVEKPFSLEFKDAEKVIKLASKNNLQVCAAHQVLFQPTGQKYQEYTRYIKKIIHIESYFSFKTVRGAISPVDQLLDILPHPVYLLLSAFDTGDVNDDLTVEVESFSIDPSGEVRAILKKGDTYGLLVVTLNGRPVESYLRVVGSNGSIHADFVLSGVSKHLGPGASAIAAVLQPFSLARQKIFGTTANIFRLVFKKQKSYSGLGELIEKFYDSVRNGTESPVSDSDILNTVNICGLIGDSLKKADAESEAEAEKQLKQKELALPELDPQKECVLVTGGTGFLGKVLVRELRSMGWPVRVLARRVPPYSIREPGVEYIKSDIGDDIPAENFANVGSIVHLAAETAGGKEEHDRNTVGATRNMINGAHLAGIKRFINISSVAVMKPSSQVGGPLNEQSPVDDNNLGRGPYVWGKAEAEKLVESSGREYAIDVKTIRLGPLVDFDNYTPPGRLGREVGTLFVAMGSKKSKLSLCDVKVASGVIRSYLEDFDQAPPLLNLIEPEAPTRKELMDRLLRDRQELSVFWMPNFVLKTLSVMLKGVLKVMKPGKKPLDLYAAFAAEKYDATLAGKVIENSRKGQNHRN